MDYMKYIPIFLTLMFFLSSVSIINAEETPSNTIYVSMRGNDISDGLTPENSKRTIVNAVKKAKDGDIIQIAPGTYTENTIVIDKKITLRGTDPTNTIIQNKKQSSIIVVEGKSDVLIQKLTITRDKTKKYSQGILNKGSLTVEDSIITKHKYSGGFPFCGGRGISNNGKLIVTNSTISRNSGGGISTYGGSLSVQECQITGNRGWNCGGITCYNSKVLIGDSVIEGNKAVHGGGICSKVSAVTIKKTDVVNNEAGAFFPGDGGYGAGICSLSDRRMDLYDCRIADNKANYGGGIYGGRNYEEGGEILPNLNVNLHNCIIEDNTANYWGGGLYIEENSKVVLNDSIITYNFAYKGAGGVYGKKESIILNNSKIIHNIPKNIYN